MGGTTGRVALVTGASSSWGRATALSLERAGFLTIAAAQSEAQVAALGESGCETLALDLSDAGSLERTLRQLENRFGPVFVVVNCACVPQHGPLEEVSLEAMRRAFEANVFGFMRLIQLVLPGMRRVGAGRIVHVGAPSPVSQKAGSGVYNATQRALETMLAALRGEVREFGIDVVSIAPEQADAAFAERAVASIADRGAASPYHAFSESLTSSLKRACMPGRSALLVSEQIGRTALRAAHAARPAAHYRLGTFAKLSAALRLVTPERALALALRKSAPNLS